MDTFAFIIHPIDPKRDISRKYPILGRFATDWMIEKISPLFPPVYLSKVTGIRSKFTGKEIAGFLIACPLSPQHFCRLPEVKVYRKIIETGKLAETLGAKILGLGAYTSVIGDGGITVAKNLDIPVTTGNSYTVITAIEALKTASNKMGIEIEKSTAAVVGAAGSIGKVCAKLLYRDVKELILIGRDEDRLEEIKKEIVTSEGSCHVAVSLDMDALQKADLVVSVTSAIDNVIFSHHLRSGCIVCDVARPRDVAQYVAAERNDVLVIDGGLVDIPGPVNFNFNFGLPPQKAFACMAETIALTLEERFEDYTVGKDIQIEKILEINEIASRHGFHLGGLRSFDKPVREEHILKIRRNSKRRSD